MKNIAALEKWLTKNVMRGGKGAEELRDYARAKGRADIMRRIATAQTLDAPGWNPRRTDFPGHASQKMLEEADDALKKATDIANAKSAGEGLHGGMDAWSAWHLLKNRKLDE